MLLINVMIFVDKDFVVHDIVMLSHEAMKDHDQTQGHCFLNSSSNFQATIFRRLLDQEVTRPLPRCSGANLVGQNLQRYCYYHQLHGHDTKTRESILEIDDQQLVMPSL